MNMKFGLRNLSLAVGCALGLGAGTASAQEPILFNIGTGGVTGSFYAIGGQVCNLVNKSRQAQGHALRCTVESTAGSVGNLRALKQGDLDIIFAQSDLQYLASQGEDPFQDMGAFDTLRYIAAFTTNSMQVVARNDSGIETMQDLAGKRVNTGNPGSGSEASAYMILEYFGIMPDDLAVDSKLNPSEMSKALCDGKIDALMYPSSVPVAAIEEATNTCDVHFVDMEGPELDKMLEDRPFLQKTTIPAGAYEGHEADTTTYGYAATLLTTTDLPDEASYNLAKAVMNGFEQVKAMSPSLANVTRDSMVNFGRFVPYAAGAEKYYKEAGLIE